MGVEGGLVVERGTYPGHLDVRGRQGRPRRVPAEERSTAGSGDDLEAPSEVAQPPYPRKVRIRCKKVMLDYVLIEVERCLRWWAVQVPMWVPCTNAQWVGHGQRPMNGASAQLLGRERQERHGRGNAREMK